jgi:hypothetical protein
MDPEQRLSLIVTIEAPREIAPRMMEHFIDHCAALTAPHCYVNVEACAEPLSEAEVNDLINPLRYSEMHK